MHSRCVVVAVVQLPWRAAAYSTGTILYGVGNNTTEYAHTGFSTGLASARARSRSSSPCRRERKCARDNTLRAAVAATKRTGKKIKTVRDDARNRPLRASDDVTKTRPEAERLEEFRRRTVVAIRCVAGDKSVPTSREQRRNNTIKFNNRVRQNFIPNARFFQTLPLPLERHGLFREMSRWPPSGGEALII